ncbi:MAG: DapH/DapD/GlmU-related protein [Aureliella sp.]
MGITLVVFGDRTAEEIIEAQQAANSSDFDNIERVFFEQNKFEEVDAPRIEQHGSPVHYVVGIADHSWKNLVVQAAEERGWLAHTVVHPSAVVSPTAYVGQGCFVGPQAVVSTNAQVGGHSLIHIHSSIGHDASIGEQASILPGARISGNAVIGKRCLVGSNAFVAAGVELGNDCFVDALAYVARDIDEGMLVSSRSKIPVKRIRTS